MDHPHSVGVFFLGEDDVGQGGGSLLKLQRRDIMCSMVKLHDLVDLAEPPWRSMVDTSSTSRPHEEAMELDEALENWDEDVMKPPASPGETNLGLA